MKQNFINNLSDALNISIKSIQPVSGGDISLAYKIESSNNTYFLKVNYNASAMTMFQQEAIALQTISKTNTIKTPRVINVSSFENQPYLLLEYIENKTPSNQEMAIFGEHLAHLHLKSSDAFGFDTDNFIGSLPQSNKKHSQWVDFYIEERLLPQLETAVKRHLLSTVEVPNTNIMKLKTAAFFKDVKPSLLHGDLWSGNYIISKDGIPYLIDPATYYGDSEVDIAMSLLFGGFSNSFYEAYHAVIPKETYTAARIELYQLYYLLVHLNLFGNSYYNSVKRIIGKYF